LLIVKSPQFNEKLSNVDEIWCTKADLKLNDSHVTKSEFFLNSRWLTAAILKIVFAPVDRGHVAQTLNFENLKWCTAAVLTRSSSVAEIPRDASYHEYFDKSSVTQGRSKLLV